MIEDRASTHKIELDAARVRWACWREKNSRNSEIRFLEVLEVTSDILISVTPALLH